MCVCVCVCVFVCLCVCVCECVCVWGGGGCARALELHHEYLCLFSSKCAFDCQCAFIYELSARLCLCRLNACTDTTELTIMLITIRLPSISRLTIARLQLDKWSDRIDREPDGPTDRVSGCH